MWRKHAAHHPYLSYAEGSKSFVRPDGQRSFKGWHNVSDFDVSTLWTLGRDAFAALPAVASKEEFDQFYEKHLADISTLRTVIKTASDLKGIVFKSEDGDLVTPDLDELSATSVLDMAWQFVRKDASTFEFLNHNYLFVCLEEVDDAIVGLCLDGGAVGAALMAANAYANFQAIESGNDSLQKARSDLAMRAAIERHRQDPKQAAKQLVKECWYAWQMRPELYRSQSVFATDMLTKVAADTAGNPIISHDTIVKKWIPEWSKSRK
jgi:hypothetical protein